ncbi:MAG TPA: NAD(+)/NADH kinase [Candidatus Binatus sp.]|uniref:NAD(+)/NADH kinase n=1 Tax=Candidatus Binatus sp. TaxID=2811406 RepID=UPI002B49FA80|nr:NAD(+)/NADH kinase [Candidatus Binatus sp.]HKN12816.1 NAD(+)/NADH kinase [Candidatus Binatus sp.]
MAVTKRSIKTVGLVVKRERPEAIKIARILTRFLRGKHKTPIADSETAKKIGAEAVERHHLADRADLIVVLGGDGTLLGVARLVASEGIPILGVNLGGLGFLTEVTIKEARAALGRVLNGDYEVDRRIMLEAIVERASEEMAQTFQAFNDVVVGKGPLGRMLQLDVFANRMAFCSYRADGLIVATPTGSTAYALAAGGPIVYPTLNAIVLAPICPHTLSNRPVVLPDTYQIEIHVKAPDHDTTFTVDGQESAQLGPADIIRIHRARHFVSLIRSAHPYFEIWRDKLHWG